MARMLRWSNKRLEPDSKYESRELRLTVNGQSRSVATVWTNGVWHTWDEHGTGGENDSEDTMQEAMVEAAASAIDQGFI